MLRFLYRWLLRLHPPGFRERFAEEMACIFDETLASHGGKKKWLGLRLVGDGVLSLLRQGLMRQWTRTAEPQQEARAFASNAVPTHGSPVFCSLPTFRPRPGAIVYGAALSLATFCVVFFAMRYSWTHRAAIILPVGSYGADSAGDDSRSRPEGFVLPSVAASGDTAGQPPRSGFDATETTQPPKPKTSMSAEASEGEVEPATIPARIVHPSYPETAARTRKRVGESTPDKSSSTLGLLPEPVANGNQNGAVSEPSSAEWLQAYVGTYVVDATSQEITVSANGEQLDVEIEGRGKVAAIAASRTKFLLEGETLEGKAKDWIEFVRDQDGAVRELDIYRDGKRQTARRR